MTAARIHSVIAAALEDNNLLQYWMKHPEQIRAFGVDPEQVDWQGLWNFAGISTKVRHNPLRDVLPLTFRVLKATSMEVEIFSHYASEAARLRSNGVFGISDKIASLYQFLEDWLDPADKRHALIWDILRHEVTLAELREIKDTVDHSVDHCEKVYLNTALVPQIRGHVILHRMHFDPVHIEEYVLGQAVNMNDLDRQELLLAYSRNLVDGEPALRLLHLDPFAFHLLAMSDGNISIDSIGIRMRQADIVVKDDELLATFSSLRQQGVIHLLRVQP